MTTNKTSGVSVMEPRQGFREELTRPDPQVQEKPTRRRFTASYKLQLLQQADACNKLGDIGRLLRREGLYSSHLTSWRRQRERGSLDGLTPKKRGRTRWRAYPPAFGTKTTTERERTVNKTAPAGRADYRGPKKSLTAAGNPAAAAQQKRGRLMEAVEQLAPEVGTKGACEALGVSPATLYRQRATQAAPPLEGKRYPSPPRSLSLEERESA